MAEARIDGVVDVLLDRVEGGASASFMSPPTRDGAVASWRRVARGVASGERALLVAEDDQGICGTVQLILDLPEIWPHRADRARMLEHRRAQRLGLGAALTRAAGATAPDRGRKLLVPDAVRGGDASRLYERPGWIRVNVIPGFALMPLSRLCSTTFSYRNLGGLRENNRPGAPGQEPQEQRRCVRHPR